MSRYVKRLLLGLVCAFGLAANAAVPEAVVTLARQMKEDGAESRAGYAKPFGVFVVATGSAPITGSQAKAKTIARANAVQNIAAFMGNQVSSKTHGEASESSSDGQAEIREFFSTVTETHVRELLKGVQDLSMEDDGDSMVATVYLTTKAADKSAELKAAMAATGDVGTVRAVGEADTHQNAVQVALRLAVEQVLGTLLAGETKVTDNEKVKSRIYAGAEGFVDAYRVVEETEVTVGWRIAVVAKVSKKKLLDSYRVYLKMLGDPVFYLECTSSDSDGEDKQIAARFGQFFRKLGFKTSKTPEGADYVINASGEYRRVQNPVDEEQTFTQYSMIIRVLSKTGEELLSIPNNPKKSAVCLNNPERERELCAEKAFKQMEKPVHEAVNDMVARMMADHTDKFFNGGDEGAKPGPTAPPPAADAPVATVAQPRAGGLVKNPAYANIDEEVSKLCMIEAKSAQTMIDEYLSAKGWTLGLNGKDGKVFYVATGTGVIQAPRSKPGSYVNSRVNAFNKAMLEAKQSMVEYLGVQIKSATERLYQEGDLQSLKKAEAELDGGEKTNKPVAHALLKGLLSGIANSILGQVDVSMHPDSFDPLASAILDEPIRDPAAEQKAAEEQALLERLRASETYKKFVSSMAQAQVVGLQSICTFEGSPTPDAGEIGVVAIWSPKLQAMASSIATGKPVPAATAKRSIAEQLADNPGALLSTFGVQQRIDENGDLVLVGFGQAGGVSESKMAAKGAQSRAKMNAMAAIREFAGENVAVATKELSAETAQEFVDGLSAYQDSSALSVATKATAEKMNISGISVVRNWECRHPLTGTMVYGVVCTWMPKQAGAAKAFKAMMGN